VSVEECNYEVAANSEFRKSIQFSGFLTGTLVLLEELRNTFFAVVFAVVAQTGGDVRIHDPYGATAKLIASV